MVYILPPFVRSVGWLGVGIVAAWLVLARFARTRPVIQLAAAWVVVGLGVLLTEIVRLPHLLVPDMSVRIDEMARTIPDPFGDMFNLIALWTTLTMVGVLGITVRHARVLVTGRLVPAALAPSLAAMAAAPLVPTLHSSGMYAWGAPLAALAGATAVGRFRDDVDSDALAGMVATALPGTIASIVFSLSLEETRAIVRSAANTQAETPKVLMAHVLSVAEVGAFGFWMMLAPIGAAWWVTERHGAGRAGLWAGVLGGTALASVGLAIACLPILGLAFVLASL